jgi:hypothetical protein
MNVLYLRLSKEESGFIKKTKIVNLLIIKHLERMFQMLLL